MLVANSFDLWQRDAFFSAAEEVQESAENLESAYRTWVSEKREGVSLSHSDELLRAVQTALGTAKWQLEEFERAVRLGYGTCRDQSGMARHEQFIVAVESQISRVEDALRGSLEEEGKEPLRWVNLNADERDDLAMFLSGTPREFTKSAQDESAKPSLSSKMEILYKSENLDYAACSSSGSVEANIQAKCLTSLGDDVVINIGPPNCSIEHNAVEAIGTRGDFYCESDRASSTRRTRVSPKFSTLRVMVPNEDDEMGTLMPTIEATPKVKGRRTSSYFRLRAMNCINKLFNCSSGLKSTVRSHQRLPLSSSMRLLILLTASFFLLVLTALMIMPCQSKVRAYEPEPGASPTWAKTVAYGKERRTVLQVYFHDVVTGNSTTAIQVVPAPGSTKPFTGFGFIAMADDPLTVGPDQSSKLVGRAQGLYGGSSKEDPSLIMALTFNFLEGIYNGSSVSILCHNMITTPEREFPVVGGTGVFRMARGYALARTFSFNLATGNAIVGYNVTVIH